MHRQTIHWYAFGPFRIAPSERVLRNNGDIIPIAPKVFDMLLALVESRGRVVLKEELLERIWPGVFVEEANLNVNMSVLRRVLGDNSRKHEYIETIPKRGYRFVAPVQELDEPCAEPSNGPTTGQLPEENKDRVGPEHEGKVWGKIERREADRRQPATPQLSRTLATFPFLTGIGRLHRIGAGALVLVTVGVLIFYWEVSKKESPSIPSTPVRSIAILPFKPLGSGPRDEALELGIADTLITRLSNLRQLIVRPTSAVRKFNALDQDPVAAGRALGADVVLDGSFQKVDDKIRVTVRLVRVADDVSLWAGQFDEPFTNIFSLQDAITTKVASRLVINLSIEETHLITKPLASDGEAYRLYLLGRFYWNQKTEEGLRKGLDYFGQAIGRDPAYALAHAGLADCYNSLAALSLSPPREVLPKAEEAAKQAIQLDDRLAEAHAALSLVKLRYRWDWAGAEIGFRHALGLNPNSPSTHQWFCEYLTAMGRFDEAFAEINKALTIDPISLTINSVRGMTFHYAGRYDEAIAQQRKTIELDPNFPWAHAYLAMSTARKGMHAEAIAEAQKALRLSNGSPRLLAGLGRVYAQAGQTSKAEEVLEQLRKLGEHQYVSPFHTALIYEALGRNDEAFMALDKAYAERSASLIYANVLPFRIGFRKDSRLADLLARMNLGKQLE